MSSSPTPPARPLRRMGAMGISPNSFGMHMATAAYSPEGAAWVDALMHLSGRQPPPVRRRVAAIPGLRSMPLESTYLAGSISAAPAWRPPNSSPGSKRRAHRHEPRRDFGSGGESFLRFNIACPRAQVEEAVARLQTAFADLQCLAGRIEDQGRLDRRVHCRVQCRNAGDLGGHARGNHSGNQALTSQQARRPVKPSEDNPPAHSRRARSPAAPGR
jgi:hypothetical protein